MDTTRNTTMKKLPLGIQTFSHIMDKQEDYLYVDKTEIALKIITGGRRGIRASLKR